MTSTSKMTQKSVIKKVSQRLKKKDEKVTKSWEKYFKNIRKSDTVFIFNDNKSCRSPNYTTPNIKNRNTTMNHVLRTISIKIFPDIQLIFLRV